MSETAIRVQHVWKKFEIGELVTMRDLVRLPGRAVRWPLRRLGLMELEDRSSRELWALRDISFEVNRGESLGIIGGNGAGKSTLLKVLSRITAPTRGRIELNGRIASLLEVGTGMHPELTGRENIYLNGAILGMNRVEVRKKFDEIVEFAGVERFIDTPIKRYSSGMRVRLGFAVAAHLDPEILIVDEVLAVGDVEFQRRCLDKMDEVTRGGRTVLFVSHNMGSIQTLCDRAIVLSGGEVVGGGAPSEAVRLYLQMTASHSDVDVAERTARRGQGGTRLVKVSIGGAQRNDSTGLLLYGEGARVDFEVSQLLPDLHCTFAIYDSLNRPMCRFTSRVGAPDDVVVTGRTGFTCEIPEMPLVPGEYHINVAIFSSRGLEDHLVSALKFRIEEGMLAGRPLASEHKTAAIAPRHRWIVPGSQTSSNGLYSSRLAPQQLENQGSSTGPV